VDNFIVARDSVGHFQTFFCVLKVKQVVKPLMSVPTKKNTSSDDQFHERKEHQSSSGPKKINRIQNELLEVESNSNGDMDFSKIVKDNQSGGKKTTNQKETNNRITEREESNFVDDPDVPPLI